MRPEEIKKRLKVQPFRPFTMCMSDGKSIAIMHPEMAIVTRTVVAVAVPGREGNGDDLPEELFWCDPIHVVRIEPVDV